MSGVSLGVFFLGTFIGFQLKTQDIGMYLHGLGWIAVHPQNFLEVIFYPALLTVPMPTKQIYRMSKLERTSENIWTILILLLPLFCEEMKIREPLNSNTMNLITPFTSMKPISGSLRSLAKVTWHPDLSRMVLVLAYCVVAALVQLFIVKPFTFQSEPPWMIH